MTVEEILAQVAQHGGHLLIADDKLHVNVLEGSIPRELLDEIRANKRALIAQLRLHQQMCFNLVRSAVETVAEQYPSGCHDSLSLDDRKAIREVEGAMEEAAVSGDIDGIEETAVAYVDLWKRVTKSRALVADVLSGSVDDWCARPDRPTVVLDTPHGEVLLVADRAAHAAAVEAGRVVFSPLEVEQLLEANKNLLVDPEFIRSLIETKRVMPGARLDQVRGPGGVAVEGDETASPATKPPRRPTEPHRPEARRPESAEPCSTEKPPAQLSLLGAKS